MESLIVGTEFDWPNEIGVHRWNELRFVHDLDDTT